ncbi:carbohydrate ABC transporter permease [Cohnella thailandensis]|uniref:Sugar ABC transporter permease n=1 Tax=Cohnella thailandensis TaxID=557557 RepID=A0A841SVU8_9BACL|nr:sugar ABC transporter permease [Cohnella thailandensis]MBB6632831.1 sugar ABC transporter permease [Cohnella thailandensis]MBP1975475.1 raffinose/stachyose/melibiose transport system permease protein [Cohnella thailandensis]
MSKIFKRIYTYQFLLPAAIVYLVIFVVPTGLSFFFSLTRWTLSDWELIGFDNFVTFFKEPSLSIGFRNTFIFAAVTCLAKVAGGLLLGVFLTSKIRSRNYLRSIVFFPTLVSTIAVGIVFSMMMHPTTGLLNTTLAWLGFEGPDWLGDTRIALLSVAFVDVWRGIGFATVIYIAGILAIPAEYSEALQIDGGNAWNKFWSIIVPLSRPATNSVIILSFIGGLRSFDLIWAMTRGGPGFATDVIASIIYKQYQGGFYGLATAGNVILFIFVTALVFPLSRYLNRTEVDL